MAYQSEAALEQQFIEQLNKQEYSTVDIPDYDALVENFKVQFEAFNAPKLDTPITDKEWERIFNLMLGKSVFQSAKILRDKFVLEREDGTKVYLSFFDQDHTKNIFQVTHQTTVVGKYVNRYDVTILVNGLPLIQVELKRRGIDIREAVNQVMRYKKHSYNGLYDIKHIKEELSRTDNPQLLRKVEILQAFLDRVVVGLESADEIDAAYNDFENEAKREEIVAFAKTEDIDSSISINKTVQRIYDKKKGESYLHIGPPKTKTSARTIPVPSLLMNIIKKFYTDNPNHYFLTGKTKPTEPRTYRQFFTRFLKRNGLEKVKFHEIRHIFAVRAIEIPEFDIKSLSEILGHKNVSFTLNVYGSANLQQKVKCMNLLNDLL